MRIRRTNPDGTLGPWEYINPKAETPEEKIARLEKESLVAMAALADKHEETLRLKQMNEELMQMNLVALEGVALLNEEVQQLKNKAPAD